VERLDDFEDISGWSAIASGRAQLTLSQDAGESGRALRFDYDFKEGGGFVVARKSFPRTMPSSWALELRVRGVAPANKLELKLADPSNRNVWWWHCDAFQLPARWETLRIRSSEVAFAWGPAGGGTLRELGAVEIAIAAGPGGKGTVWLDDLRFEDLSLRQPPRVSASSHAPGYAAEHALDGFPETSWRSDFGSSEQWLELDFGREHEYGGLVIDWEPGFEARALDVQASDDGRAWTTLWSAGQVEGPRSYVYLPDGRRSRWLRLLLIASADPQATYGIRRLDVRPFDFSRSLSEFFHAVAASDRRGLHPRWLHREQSYWTAVGIEGGRTAAILNEEGMLEPDRGSFSLEPFLFADDTLITWADVEVTQSLAERFLPIPSVVWWHDHLALTTTAFAVARSTGRAARVRYRVENRGRAPARGRLFAALRPFQVTPPWQTFQGLGGTSPIRELAWSDGAVLVNGSRRVVPIVPPSAFGAAAFEQGGALRHLGRGEVPPGTRVTDAFGHASGAMAWDFEIEPAGAYEVEVEIPFDEPSTTTARELPTLRRVTRFWEEKLGQVRIRLPASASEAVDALRTATAHVLVCRDGPALQPGPRRYTRSWIRDGATMSAALLRMRCSAEVREFLRWYAPHQRDDGNVPCAVDRNGPDWLPEHDSHGQFAFTVAEYFRLTGDPELARELWPGVVRAIDYLEALREQRCAPEFRAPEKRACFGILPESASHEGYLAHPVHAYWDDFWALRGVGDALALARALGDGAQAERLARLHGALHGCVYASIEATIADRKLAYVPGSVEWADFDAAATATAIVTTDAAERLPADALAFTFDEYLRGFRRRRCGQLDWNNYTAYEIRILAALVRLGRRDDAHELLDFFLADRRPRAWNQWPEISWRDPRSPGHLGDVPHAWIGAEYVLALLSMLAHERPSDSALVLAAGVSAAWLDSGEIAVEHLPTWWGPLRYSLRRTGPAELRLDVAGVEVPPGGIVARPPLPRPLMSVEIDGAPVRDFARDAVTLRSCPARVVMRF